MRKKKLVITLITIGVVLGCGLLGCNLSTHSESSDVVHSWKDVTSQVVAADSEGGFRITPEIQCSGCHEKEFDSALAEDCLYGVEEHADAECIDCHLIDGPLKKAHSKYSPGSTMRGELKRTNVANMSCLESCHEDDDLVDLTSMNTVLTDKKGTMVNPHSVSSIGTGHAEVTCSSCHSMHANNNTEEAAQALCLSCHHEDVYECGTCH